MHLKNRAYFLFLSCFSSFVYMLVSSLIFFFLHFASSFFILFLQVARKFTIVPGSISRQSGTRNSIVGSSALTKLKTQTKMNKEKTRGDNNNYCTSVYINFEIIKRRWSCSLLHITCGLVKKFSLTLFIPRFLLYLFLFCI